MVVQRACSAAGSASSATRAGGPGPRRVASSAARVVLPGRRARARGWRRSRSTTSRRPSTRPACGPPSSLSPLHVTTAAPSRRERRGIRLVGQQRVRPQQAAADVVHDRGPQADEVGDRDRAGEAGDREVAGVHLEHRAGARGRRRPRSRARWVRFVVPTSRSRAPHDVMRSGSRKPSPISTSSPRLTTTSAPAASAVVASTRAAAPLLTTRASSASGTAASRASRAPGARGPRRPVARSSSTSTVPAAATSASPGGRGQRRPAQVGVQHDAGRVEHRPQRGGSRRQGLERGVDDPVRGEVARAHAVLRGGHGACAPARGPGCRVASCRRGSASTVSVRGTARRGSGAVVLGHRSSSTSGGGGRESNPPSRAARLHRC